jgi:hypothetical protein
LLTQGATLYYYRAENLAGAHKLLGVLSPESIVKQGEAAPGGVAGDLPRIVVTVRGGMGGSTRALAAQTPEEHERWVGLLKLARAGAYLLFNLPTSSAPSSLLGVSVGVVLPPFFFLSFFSSFPFYEKKKGSLVFIFAKWF